MLLLLIVFVSWNRGVAETAIKVPKGKHVMIDGQCTADEWLDAAKTNVSQQYQFYVKKNADFVYICISSAKETNLMIDLYFSPVKEKLYTFHASAKLGERILDGNKWRDFTTDWRWWQIDGWTANTLRLKSFKEATFLPGTAIEFQIDRKRFTGRDWRIMLDFIAEEEPFIFPIDADKLKSDKWLRLKL